MLFRHISAQWLAHARMSGTDRRGGAAPQYPEDRGDRALKNRLRPAEQQHEETPTHVAPRSAPRVGHKAFRHDATIPEKGAPKCAIFKRGRVMRRRRLQVSTR
jgi:hypothetical protein